MPYIDNKNPHKMKKFISTIKEMKINKVIIGFQSIVKKKVEELDLKKFERFNSIRTIKIFEIYKKPIDYFVKAQNLLENKVQRNEKSVVLQRSNLWAKYITGSLIGGTIFGIGWLTLAQTEEIIIVQGKLEPLSGVIDVQMPIEGITKEILVKEGERVTKGQVLIKLDKDITTVRQDSLLETYKINQEILNRLNTLQKEGAVAELQYLQQLNKTLEIEKQINENKVLLDYQLIKAPISGLVFDLQPQKPGYVASTSQPILKIVPLENLVAKIEIDSRSIGFVSTGKKADISIDSYPATDFGIIEGEVTKIGSDALPPDPREGKGYRFPSEIKLKEQFLKLKNGKKLPLQVGMSLSANIKLRKVSYLKLLLGTFQTKADSLRSL